VAITDEQLESLFFAESEEQLASAGEALLVAEKAGTPEEAVAVLFRAFHSIKGGAMSLDLGDMAELAHRLEDLLDLARQQAITIDDQTINLIFAAIDSMEALLQVHSGKACRIEMTDSSRKDLMDEIARAIEGKKPTPACAVTNMEISTASIDPDKRLAYCEVRLVGDCEMPSARMMLILKRLEEIGQVVYSYPDMASQLSGAHENERLLKAIVSTDLGDTEIAGLLEMASVDECRVMDVASGGQPQKAVRLPSMESLDRFQRIVSQLSACLEAGGESDQTGLLSSELRNWGKTDGTLNDWFPGGLQAWQVLADLLDTCIKFYLERQDNFALQRQVKAGLQGLWQSVFAVLSGVRYYRSFNLEGMSLGIAMTSVVDQVLEEKEVRLALLDISGVSTLEAKDLQVFGIGCTFLANNGVKVAMFAGGKAGRRHQNVLEALRESTGGLVAWPTAFEAAWRKLPDPL